MKTGVKLSLLTASILTFSTNAEEAEKNPIDVTAELGILVNSGNTESSSIFGKVAVNHDLGSWKNKYTFDILNKEGQITNEDGSKETVKTDERFTLTAQANYKFSETSAAFLFGSYTDDEFGAYAKYTTVAAGYNFRAYEQEKMFLDLNIGPGFSTTEAQDGTEEDGAVLRLSSAFSWDITDTAKFINNISVESAEFNTRTTTETAVSASLSDTMQMKFGFKTVTDSDVAPGLKKTDTETSMTVVVNF